MKNHIDLTPYRMQRVIDGSDIYELNIGSTSPLHARESQKKLTAEKKARKITYTSVTGESFSLLVSNRQFQLLAVIRDKHWHTIESLKTTKAETRKPISELRQLGLIIGTKRSPSQYKLFGSVELYPLGLGIGIKPVTDILPSISECVEIEEARTKAKTAKSFGRIKKAAEFLSREG